MIFLHIFLPFLLPLTLSYMAGIVCAYYATSWYVPVLFFTAGIGFSTLFLKSKQFFKTGLICCFFLLGALRTHQVLKNNNPTFPLYHVTVEGNIDSIAYCDSKPWRYQTILKVHRVFDAYQWKENFFTLHIYTTTKPTFKVADTIQTSLEKITQPEKTDFALYALKEGFDATTFQAIITSKCINRPTYSLKRWFAHKKRIVHCHLLKKMNLPTFALFSSLFLGNRTGVKQSIEKEKPFFKTWGISHFLARSGLHLLICICLWSAILSFVPLPFFIKHLILMILSLFYFFFSWPSISFNRAFYTFLLYTACVLLKHPLASMHTISAVCLIILAYNPLHLFFLDFQLTFLLTFSLIWIAAVLYQRMLFYRLRAVDFPFKNTLNS